MVKEVELKVLKILERSEERLGFTLLDRRAGGSSGGSSRLTPKAKELMERYKLFNYELLTRLRRLRISLLRKMVL